jgi:hypothetical protein
MSNGHVSEVDLEVNDPDQNIGYLPKSIPDLRDREIEDLLSRCVASEALASLQRCVDEDHAMVLRAFAERMATTAVRNNNATQLRTGLIALLLTQAESDFRDGLMILPLYCDAIAKLHIDPSEFTDSVRQIVGNQMLVPFTEFLRRADKSLKSMGYIEGADADGFRYLRNW